MKETLKIVIGTRKSLLARAQARLVKERLAGMFPQYCFVLKGIVTSGDRLRRWPLGESKGLFVKEIESALRTGKIDLAVHSMKDLPVEAPEGLEIAAVTKREAWQDVLVSNFSARLAELKKGARVGTSSPRRKIQLLDIRPDLKVKDIRGNLDTRLRRLKERRFDAIVVAAAGLYRLKREKDISEILRAEIMLPAPGQGALGIQIRSEDTRMKKIVKKLDHRKTRIEVKAEREFLKKMGGGCRAPVAVLARVIEGELVLNAAAAGEDLKFLARVSLRGRRDEGPKLAAILAGKIKRKLERENARNG